MVEVYEDKSEFKNVVDDYKLEGWKVLDSKEKRVVLRQGYKGSWWWHLFWVLFFPLGTLGYMVYRRTDNRPKKKTIRLEQSEQKEEEENDTDEA
jgi:hypothetical protein